jgi:hypothetical protein
MGKNPNRTSEKQWILNYLKRINQTLLRSFKDYQYEIPFHPTPAFLTNPKKHPQVPFYGLLTQTEFSDL